MRKKLDENMTTFQELSLESISFLKELCLAATIARTAF